MIGNWRFCQHQTIELYRDSTRKVVAKANMGQNLENTPHWSTKCSYGQYGINRGIPKEMMTCGCLPAWNWSTKQLWDKRKLVGHTCECS